MSRASRLASRMSGGTVKPDDVDADLDNENSSDPNIVEDNDHSDEVPDTDQDGVEEPLTDDNLPSSEEAADDPHGVLDELEGAGLQPNQTPEQRLQAATNASSAPGDAHRMVAAEGDAHALPNTDLTPQKVMSIQNEAYSNLVNPDATPDVIETVSIDDVRGALAWAMHKLTHPSEQMGFCETHGKVPLTHMCSIHRDEQYASALRLLEPSK